MRYIILLLTLSLAPVFTFSRSLAQIVVDGNSIMDQSMEENLCALTFDDGPSPNTLHLLKQLEEYGIKATFFILGSQAYHYPHILENIKNAGHEIGNHSWSHANLRVLSSDRQREEIMRTDELLRSHGIAPLYLRPPYGSFDERIVKIADELGLSLILWSLDSLDWKHVPDNYARLLSTRGTIYEDGNLHGIFLFHDIHKSTVDDLPRILDNLRAGGCTKFVTVSEYLQGVRDLEPPLVMTRKASNNMLASKPMLPADISSAPFARCSLPHKKADVVKMDLVTAHAHMQNANEIASSFQERIHSD